MEKIQAKEKWQFYADVWSMDEGRYLALEKCVVPKVTYRDPSSKCQGIEHFSNYMKGFQASLPGANFEIKDAFVHHNRTLAHWSLVLADGSTLHDGTSFALMDDQGRFIEITGFFDLSKTEQNEDRK